MDVVPPDVRSRIMSSIRGKDTRPEMLVRRFVHAMGYRYRLHVASLPGKPDLVFAKREKVILVNGCFWHAHTGCLQAKRPQTRAAFWRDKFAKNRARDARNIRQLRRLGWRVLIVWECQTRDPDELAARLQRFLGT